MKKVKIICTAVLVIPLLVLGINAFYSSLPEALVIMSGIVRLT